MFFLTLGCLIAFSLPKKRAKHPIWRNGSDEKHCKRWTSRWRPAGSWRRRTCPLDSTWPWRCLKSSRKSGSGIG